ncbi:MAG: hypothetical protein KA206_07880 [Paludibacter sp.]|nr:hypothetical protein [Paludibacter sp.]
MRDKSSVAGSELMDKLTPLGYRNSKVGEMADCGIFSIFKGTKNESWF